MTLPPIMPGSAVRHLPSGQIWLVYSCSSAGFYPAGWPEGYCSFRDVEVATRANPHEALWFLVSHPPTGDGSRANCGRENLKWIVLHLASTDEECELLEAISKVAGTGNAVKKAGHGDGGKYCKAHGKAHPPPDAATRTFWSVHRHYPYDVEPVTATSWTETCLWITVPDTEHCGGYTYAAKRNSKDTSYFDDEAAALECALELHRARLSSLASMMEYGVKACRIAEERLGRVGKDG